MRIFLEDRNVERADDIGRNIVFGTAQIVTAVASHAFFLSNCVLDGFVKPAEVKGKFGKVFVGPVINSA